MAILKFKIHADYERVMRLKEEIAKLEKQMKSFGRNTPINEIKTVEKRLAEAKAEMTGLVSEAAKAGAIMEKGFKTKIYDASVAVNSLTEKIIDQRSAVRGAENEVKRLGEAYRKAMKEDAGNAPMLKTDYDKAKDALNKEKNALFELTQEKAKASLETKKLRDEYSAFKQEAGEAVKANEGLTLSLGKIAGLVGGAAALKELGSQVVKVRGEFQEMETVISTLVGQDMADKLMPQLKEMAKISPLSLGDIIGAEKMMLGFNIEADKTIGFLKALGDVSMGNSQKFNSLTLAFSQMSASGRLMGNDLNQMINAGFNPLQVIAEKTGKSIAQLKDEMSKGAISAEMVQQAFIDATSAGGRFYNMSENTSKLINGQMSMMQDAIDATLNAIGTKTEGIILKSIQATTSLIQNYEKIGKVLVGLVATYGVYRTAVLLSTAATSKHTIAEIALINVRIAARKAQTALNSAMLTNPYVALATAVAGLVAGYIALKDNTTAAEKAQRDYGKMKENASQKEKEHADAIQSLIDKVRDETQAEVDRTAALMALKDEYPAIFANYDVEKLKLEDILKLKKLINEEDAARRKAGNRELLAEYDQSIAKAEDDIRNAPKMGAGSLAYLAEAQKRLERLKALREALLKDMKDTSVAEFTGSLADKSLQELQEYLKSLEAGTFELDGSIADTSTANTLKDAVKKAIDNLNNASKTSYSVDYEEAKRAWEKAKAQFEEVRKDKERFTTEEYNERKNALEKAEKDFKALGGDTTGKGAKTEADAVKEYNEQLAQQERVYQAQRRAEKDKARTAKDQEFMVSQARIDAMKEGAEKTRAQRELDNQRELEDLERQKQDYIDRVVENERAIFEAQEEQRAKNNEKYKKQSFDSEAARAKVDTTAYDNAIALTLDKQKGQQDEVLVYLLEQYKSYEDAKQEIIISYLNESDELQAMYEETGDERFRRSLEERHKAYVQALNKLEQEMGTVDYKLIFGDPSKMTSATIEKALDVARKKMAQLDKDADPETFQALSEAIERLENARDNNPFEGWGTSLMGVIQSLHQIRNIERDIERYEAEGNKDAQEEAESQLEKSKFALKNALIGTGASEFADSLTQAAEAMKKIAEAAGDVQLSGMAEQMGAWAQNLTAAAQGAASGGWIGAIVGGVSDIISQTVQFFVSSKVSVEQTSKEVEDFRHQIEMLKYVVEDSDFSNIFGVDGLSMSQEALRKATKAIEDYQAMMNELNSNTMTTLYEKEKQAHSLGAAIMLGSWGSLRKVVSNEMKGALEAFKKGYSQLEAMQVKTKDVNGWGNFWGFQDEYTALKDLAPELWDEDGVFDVDAARAFLETTTQLNEEQKKQIQNIIDLKDAYDEADKALEDYLEDLYGTWGEDLGSIISDSVLEGVDAWDAFGEKGADVIKRLGQQALYTTFFKDTFEAYTEPLKAAVGDPDEMARLTADLMADLKSNFDVAQEWMKEYYDRAEAMDIDMQGLSGYNQSASRRGYETLSEDTGNELAGRMLAQYESNLRMEEATRSMKLSIDLMADNQIQIRDIAADSRALIAASYLELKQITENTGAIIKPINDISANIREMNRKIDNL